MHYIGVHTGATSSRVRTYPSWVRLAALFCVAFFALASARGFVPSLCVTTRTALSAPQTHETGALLEPQRACCSIDRPSSGTKPSRHLPVGNAGCALCNLAKSPFEPLVQVLFAPPAPLLFAAMPLPTATAPDRVIPDPSNPRAPPYRFTEV
ncbi:MAG: hypothetical protein HYV27_23745 [Candidatus Hydrogenedentes bacterium]|nr:hypothetical protein [Candidatus Hydrogenedentota bacterium]